MFSKDPVPHLRDILIHIAHIERVLNGVSYEKYASDRDVSALTERYLQIITEAAHRLRETADQVCPGPDWRGWRDLGNVLRHAYDKVDAEIVWNTVQLELPQLKRDVESCLARLAREMIL